VRIVIGTYRKEAYIKRALDSIEQFVTGYDGIDFVDDSGDPNWAELLRGYSPNSTVVDVGGRGYNAAMKAVCELVGDEAFVFWEEDFVALEPISLDVLEGILDDRPHLAQIALLRGPHFPIEHEHGGLLEALRAKGHEIPLVLESVPFGPPATYGVYEQTATFTCNPAMWRAGIAAKGWPDGKWSEDAKRDQLIADGYRFGFLPGIRVAHEGVRSGFDY
jgi:hypothetical protein